MEQEIKSLKKRISFLVLLQVASLVMIVLAKIDFYRMRKSYDEMKNSYASQMQNYQSVVQQYNQSLSDYNSKYGIKK